MKKLYFALLVFMVAFGFGLLLSCISSGGGGGDDDTADDDAGDDNDDNDRINGVPDEVNDFLDPEDLAKLEDAGMQIYPGDNPPNIEGSYLVDSQVIVYDEIGMEGDPVANYIQTYYDQKSDGSIKNSYEAIGIDDTATGLGAFISGDKDCFSVYVRVDGSADGCNYASPIIYSGCLADEGIEGFSLGLIMKSKQGDNCDALMPEGAARIIKEQDGLAARQ